MRDQVIDVDLAVHIPVDDFWHIGTAARAAKGRTFPFAAGDQLEGPGCDLGASFGDPDNNGLAPAAMAAFQRLAHNLGIAYALERIVGAAVSQLNDVIDDIVDFVRIDGEIGRAHV